jgi:hypothetical protein
MTSRTKSRAVLAAGCAALLAVTASACSTAERLTTGMRVRNAVVKLGDQSAATVVVSVDGSPRQAREFLRKARGGDDKAGTSEKAALRLARAELTLSAGTGDEEEETPLKEMPRSDAANVAAALNFGGEDVAGVKSVDDKLYLKADLPELVSQTEGSKRARDKAQEIVDLADDLPATLRAAEYALKGEWVRADPEAFDDFARAAEALAERRQAERDAEEDAEEDPGKGGDRGKDKAKNDRGKNDGKGKGKGEEKNDAKHEDEKRERSEQAERAGEIRDAITIGSALDGQSQREFVNRVQQLLREHAEFDAMGERGGAEHVRMTLPGRKAAKDLVGALRSLGAEIDPRRVPGGDIAADLSIRRGQLTSLTLDLGQFTRGGARGGEARLPLTLEFSGGDAVAVTAPGGTEELQPQDLVAAMMYGALGTEKF